MDMRLALCWALGHMTTWSHDHCPREPRVEWTRLRIERAMWAQCGKCSAGGCIGLGQHEEEYDFRSEVRSGQAPPEELVSKFLKCMARGKNLGRCVDYKVMWHLENYTLSEDFCPCWMESSGCGAPWPGHQAYWSVVSPSQCPTSTRSWTATFSTSSEWTSGGGADWWSCSMKNRPPLRKLTTAPSAWGSRAMTIGNLPVLCPVCQFHCACDHVHLSFEN